MINENIAALAEYALKSGLIEQEEKIYSVNLLLDILKLDDYEEPAQIPQLSLEENLKEICDFAYSKGLIEENSVVYRDLFDTKVMNCFVKRPSEIIRIFREKYAVSPKEATDFFYEYSKASDYIRTYRIERDMKWQVDSAYGPLDITINLSKPEKDPKAIAAAKNAKQSGYPKCQLCVENEGYAGRVNHPARQNHRIIPVKINGGDWGFQYSPYVYFNEHCILLNSAHEPMVIDKSVFAKLFDFLTQFPHYMICSNADLPIVGGSILSHEHFQGGNYEFPMAKAELEQSITINGYEDVEAGIVKWPMPTIRIMSTNQERLTDLADHILQSWRGYTDEEAFVFASTEGVPHNTLNPVARRDGDKYVLDLVLRNNITTEERPNGVYHPREEYFHIKKENIGIIEVMGLAILPSRLLTELTALGDAMLAGRDLRNDEMLSKHADWAEELMISYKDKMNQDNIMEILKKETGVVFTKVLEDAGVFKCTEEGRRYFMRFLEQL